MAELIIDLISPGGQPYPDTIIPGDYLVRDVIHDVVGQWNLPQFGVEYSLLWVTQNQPLDDQHSLSEAGVRNGDKVQVVSSVKVDLPTPAPFPTKPLDTDRTVEVSLLLPDLNTKSIEHLDREARVEDLISMLVKKHSLPSAVKRAANSEYKLSSSHKKEILLPGDTLRSAGIPQFDQLTLLLEAVAG